MPLRPWQLELKGRPHVCQPQRIRQSRSSSRRNFAIYDLKTSNIVGHARLRDPLNSKQFAYYIRHILYLCIDTQLYVRIKMHTTFRLKTNLVLGSAQ